MAVHGEAFAEPTDIRGHGDHHLGVAGPLARARVGPHPFQHPVNETGDLTHLEFFHASGGQPRCAETDARGVEGFAGVVGHHVAVAGDPSGTEGRFDLFAAQVFVLHVAGARFDPVGQFHDQQVVIGAPTDQGIAQIQEFGGEGLGIFDGLHLVGTEAFGHGQFKGHGLGADFVHQGTALDTGHDGFIQEIAKLRPAEDHRATGTPQGFVGGGHHKVGVGERAGVGTTGDQAGDVADIGE